MIYLSQFPAFSQMAGYLLIGIVTTLVYVLLRVLEEKDQNHPSEVPIAYHFVPWVGSPIRYATKGPRAFMLECSRRLGPIFGFKVFGQRVIMISSTNALKEVFKLDRNGALTVIAGQQMHTMAGYRGSTERCKYIYAVLQQKAIPHLYHAFSAQEIHQRAPCINLIIRNQINATLRSTGSSHLSMTYFCRHVVHQSIASFFFGRGMPDIFKDSSTLEDNMIIIMYGLERFVPSAVRSRERIYSTLADYLSDKWDENEEGHLEGASDFLSEVIRTMKTADFTHEEMARYMIPILWGATSSLMNVFTWVMGHILSDIELKNKVASEARLVTNCLTPGELLKLTPKTFSLLHLDSLIQEVLRTKTQIPLIRVAKEDLVIVDEAREIQIYKGDLIAPDAPSLNMSSAYFNEPHLFKPERFVNSSESKALYVFGAGQHSCAGQRLALHVIRMVIVLVFHSFDIKLHPKSHLSLRENPICFSPFVRTSNDLVVEMVPRLED